MLPAQGSGSADETGQGGIRANGPSLGGQSGLGGDPVGAYPPLVVMSAQGSTSRRR